jgi:hypothetical protein
MANVKVFADRQTDRQTNRRTDGQAKNYMPPIFRYGGIKNVKTVQQPKKPILCHEVEPNLSKDRAMHEGDNSSF